MDEAERCHSLSILDRGRRVAAGDPSALMEGLDATVVEVRSPDAHAASRLLDGADGVLEVTQLGTRLHVLLEAGEDGDEAAARIAARLHVAGVAGEVARVRASLEDVFVMATRT
jgi:ABC-2 type transport system ATP-binding protein